MHHPFTVVVDDVGCEDRGIIEMGWVDFHIEATAEIDPLAVEKAIQNAEWDDTTIVQYDPSSKRGDWRMVDGTSRFKAGDTIKGNTPCAP